MKELKIKKGFVLRCVANNYVVVAIGKASREFNAMVNLNESGAFLWEKLGSIHTVEGLVKAMTDEYDVTDSQAEKDILAFIDVLEKNGILE